MKKEIRELVDFAVNSKNSINRKLEINIIEINRREARIPIQPKNKVIVLIRRRRGNVIIKAVVVIPICIVSLWMYLISMHLILQYVWNIMIQYYISGYDTT